MDTLTNTLCVLAKRRVVDHGRHGPCKFKQVPGANNSKFGSIVCEEDEYPLGTDHNAPDVRKQTLIYEDQNKVQIPLLTGIARNDRSMKGNTKVQMD